MRHFEMAVPSLFSILAVCGGVSAAEIPAGLSSDSPGVVSVVERVDVEAALGAARFVGVGEQIELVVPLPMNDEARAMGAVGRQLTIKGVCGPDGAVSTPEQLLAHARRDLERMNNPGRGFATAVYGESPRFVVSYNPLDFALVTLFLPNFREAAEYVDSQLDNRIEIRIDLSTEDIPGSVIGSAGSVSYVFNYNTYRRGLQAADERIPEESNFADALPSGSLPVRYDGSSTTTNATTVVANATQARAIFGETVLDQESAVSISLDNTADWDYFVYFDDQVDSGFLSLVDVAVHEITHGLGFRSQLSEGGLNPGNLIAGLDIARFRGFPAAPLGVVGGAPLLASQFTTFPRWGDNIFLLDQSLYARPNAGNAIEFVELEGGDFSASGSLLQPSHLAYRSDFEDKIGLMDPVLARSDTFGPGYWGFGEFGPLNDMGWKLVRGIDVAGDCNGNGQIDLLDVLFGGFRDADGDGLLDVCETFLDDVSAAGSYVDRSTETVFDANGVTSLASFFPGSATVLNRFLVTSVDRDYSFSDADTVRVFSGFITAPAPDEYAFRIQHNDDALLEIAGQQFFRPGSGVLNGSLDDASIPAFIQLEQGFHEFKLTVLVRGPGPVRLLREARSLGGWGPVPQADLEGTFFDDCNTNGIDDQFDPDSDGDGIPDDCDEPDCDNDGIADGQELDCDGNGVPDDCEPRGDINLAFDVGQVGTEDQVLEFGSCGSPQGFQFDTEIAIWDSNGVLIANNDDGTGCNTSLLSRLDLTLPAGEYYIGTTGYNAFFSGGFGVDFEPDRCSEGGLYVLRVGDKNVISGVDPGKVKFIRFTVGAATNCPADLAAPFGVLNFFDVSAFLSAYGSQAPAADFAAPFGVWNFFDVSAFLGAYNAGCP